MAVNQHEVDSLAVTLIIILAKWAFEAIKDNFIPIFYDLVRYVNLSIKHQSKVNPFFNSFYFFVEREYSKWGIQ